MDRRHGERHRQRLTIAGKSALTVWIDAGLKAALTSAAAANGATMADTAAQWLMTAAAGGFRALERGATAERTDWVRRNAAPRQKDMDHHGQFSMPELGGVTLRGY